MPDNHGTYTLDVTNVQPMMDIIEAALDVVETAQRRGNVKSGDIELAKLEAKLSVVVTRKDEGAVGG